MSVVPQPYYDCNLDFPVEVEGSPAIATDEVTGALTIQRLYAVRLAKWQKIAYASVDPFFKDAFLGSEIIKQIQGPILFFNRNYFQVPAARSEPRTISFTLPGRSSVQTSKITGAVIGWNQYGLAAPLTVPRDATVEYTYAAIPTLTTDPRTIFTVPALSKLTFKGAQVDYSGAVYTPAGNFTYDTTPPITEPRFDLAGIVGGFISGQTWIVSVAITRLRGPVFVMEVVKVPNFVLP